METAIANTKPGISPSDLFALLPYGGQFLFIDEFLEADRTHIVARYRFREDLSFYPSHFPVRPITPGVILLEAMCQCGMVAQGIYLLAVDCGQETARKHGFLLTGAEVEWFSQILPGTTVIMRSELLAWKMRRIRTRVKMFNETGSLLAEALVLGMGVPWDTGAKKNLPGEAEKQL